MDVTNILLQAQNPDPAQRQAAEAALKQQEEANPQLFFTSLIQELCTEEKPPQVRQLAGLCVKNALDAKDLQRKEQLRQRWLTAIDAGVKAQMQEALIKTLASPEAVARHTTAQVIAKMATIDLPAKTWPALIGVLLNNVTNPEIQNESLKQYSLECLGYICEDVDPDVLTEQSNEILTAVVHGMRKEEANLHIKLTATKALCNSLEFARKNFESENERNYIMQVICEVTQVKDAANDDLSREIRVAAYECLVTIAEKHYDKLQYYMHVLFNLTFEAISKEEEQVAQQAIEFWSEICESEISLNEELEEAREEGREPEQRSQNYISGARKFLVPLLMELLTRQNEDAFDEECTVADAAGICLQSVAITVADDIIQDVMPFVHLHIQSSNWRYREAAIYAFGAILEGASKAQLAPFVAEATPVMMAAMKDADQHVKHTAAWTIGRICELPGSLGEPDKAQQLEALIQVLCDGLVDSPKVAGYACWAICNLAEGFQEDKEQPTGRLSRYFQHLMQCLVNASERPGDENSHVRFSAYEGMNSLITYCAEDTKNQMQFLVPAFMDKLEKTFGLLQQCVTAQDREKVSEMQGYICGAIQSLIPRLGLQVIAPCSDKLMMLLLQVFQSQPNSVHDGALLVVGTFAAVVDEHFEKYMQHFQPVLLAALKNAQDHQVCTIAVNVVGDLCRSLGTKILPYCDEIVQQLLENLRDPYLNRDVKPPILSAFGDVGLAVGPYFEKYMPLVMAMLIQAAGTQVNSDDYEMVEYLNSLREGIFEAFTGILQGLKDDKNNKTELFAPYVNEVLGFIQVVAADKERFDSVTRTAVGCIGDMAHALGPQQARQLNICQPFCQSLIMECEQSDNQSLKDVGYWAKKILSQ